MDNLKPLESVDASVFQKPLFGLLRNISGDLERRVDAIRQTNDLAEQRLAILLLTTAKFAINSYDAVSFLLADTEESSKRQPRFVFVVAPINRQLLDLWFSLVYMMDDLHPRALAYEQTGYREMVEGFNEMMDRYGSDPASQPWLEDRKNFIAKMEAQITLSVEQKANPSQIPYWPTPFKLSQRKGKCQSFLKFLEKSLYHDTSAEAHLKPGGLFLAGSFLTKDKAPEDIKNVIENRSIHQYKFKQFCRTVLVVLGIMTELEVFGMFGNKEHFARVWGLLAQYNSETKQVYDMRYRVLLE